MSRRGRDALIGLVYVVVIAALVALSVAIYQKRFTTFVDVTARTGAVGNALREGSEVKVRGVTVGQVGDVTTDGRGALVQLRLDPDDVRGLPANLTVQLLPKTLFGERYVALVLPAERRGRLRDGDVLRQDTAPHAVELQRLFADLLPVLRAVQPEKLAATLGEVAAALRDRGTELGDTLQLVGRYLQRLAPDVPRLTDDLQRLASVADTYRAAAPDLLQGLGALTTTTRTLVRQRQDFEDVLASLTRTGTTFGEFGDTNERSIIGLARDARAPLALTRRYASEFPCLSRALVAYIPRADKAFGAGTRRPGARLTLTVVPPRTPYRAGQTPRFDAADGPQCPYVPATSLASTALADLPGVPGADTATTRVRPQVAGMGSPNSPQENRLIGELLAARTGLSPAQVPAWSSLLLGPALRGTEVTVR
ncbi:MCE family protein [Jatrophihabitans fulvus]